MAYPTSTNLQTFLQGSGMLDIPPSSAQALLDYTKAINAAIEEWEDTTGRNPFLADTMDSTRYFDPPQPTAGNPAFLSLWTYTQGGMELDISNPGLVSLTSVAIGTTSFDIGGDGAIGSVYPWPENYAAIGKPISKLRFVWSGFGYGLPESIAVTGKWGYEASLSSVADDIILKKAAIRLLPSLARLKLNTLAGGAIEVKQENLSVKYIGAHGGHLYAAEESAWLKEVRKAMYRFKAKAFA